MILPQTYLATLALMILSMLCWGSWANTFKLAGKQWRFELFYFDYAVGVLLAALVYAFTVGSLGFDGFSFTDDLLHAGKRQWLWGFAGGVVFNLANMLLVAAISLAGLAVAFPVGIGVALVVGVVWNYAIKPNGNPILLFSGVGVIVVAIVVDALAYRALALQKMEADAKAGKAKSTRKSVSLKGVFISLVSGILMGCFFPMVLKGQEGEAGLGPYAVGVVFAAGVFFSTFLFNLLFMNLPVEGPPVDILDYFQGGFRQHLLGIAGGAIWCTGTIGEFRGGQCAGGGPCGSRHQLRYRPGRYDGERAVGIAGLEGVRRGGTARPFADRGGARIVSLRAGAGFRGAAVYGQVTGRGSGRQAACGLEDQCDARAVGDLTGGYHVQNAGEGNPLYPQHFPLIGPALAFPHIHGQEQVVGRGDHRGKRVDPPHIDPLGRLQAGLLFQFPPGGGEGLLARLNAPANHFDGLPPQGVLVFANEVSLARGIHCQYGRTGLHIHNAEKRNMAIRPAYLIFANTNPRIAIDLAGAE